MAPEMEVRYKMTRYRLRLVAANLPAQPASLSSSAAQPASLSGREMRDLMNAWRKDYRSWMELCAYKPLVFALVEKQKEFLQSEEHTRR